MKEKTRKKIKRHVMTDDTQQFPILNFSGNSMFLPLFKSTYVNLPLLGQNNNGPAKYAVQLSAGIVGAVLTNIVTGRKDASLGIMAGTLFTVRDQILVDSNNNRKEQLNVYQVNNY